MTKLILSCLSLACITFCQITMADHLSINVLLRPSGQYGVAFEDLHWLNTNICPDLQFSEKNENDFSPDNKRHCHELMLRVYYPTSINSDDASLYYRPTIEVEKSTLKSVPDMKSTSIDQLSQLKSHTIKNAPPVKNKKFPVVLFSPGFGVQTQLYENIITELASHGFIVIGINSVFIDGDIELPDGHIVRTILHNRSEAANKITPILEQDIAFVYKKIQANMQNKVFKSMDLNQIGALGHSIGGRAIANVVNQHKDWFQALITLDMASYKANDSLMQFKTPYMHIISAYWKSYFNWPLHYRLGKNGYLVTLSPSAKDQHYSYHLNYTDFSTLQYLPAYQASMTFEQSKLAAGEDVIIQKNLPKENQMNKINRPCYVIVKPQNTWRMFYYEPGKKNNEIDIQMVSGLHAALNDLPLIKQITLSDTSKIRNIVDAYHQQYGNYLGKGNGIEITKAIDAYVIDFFSRFLKNTSSISLEKCQRITKNTCIVCGQ